MLEDNSESWYEGDDLETNEDYSFKEYDITASPNDFNIKTIFDFIQSGIMEIPNFQRNYVWDIKRASKLIESVIIGLPIPQIFLFEESKNKFLVIDGQQRLMTIYYFINKRFPKKDYRVFIGRIFDENKKIPENILHDNQYFEDFNLKLVSDIPGTKNPLNNINYATLDKNQKTAFDLRTIRNVIIKQNFPPDDDSSIYEIFSRLNSGGMNLKPQEIRSSLYNSNFYRMLKDLNEDNRWRRLIGRNEDIHLKDIEILLRGFAMLIEGYEQYTPSMSKFLNKFSKRNKAVSEENIQYLKKLFNEFLNKCDKLDKGAFFSKTGKFNISMFEAIFSTICEEAFRKRNLSIYNIDKDKLDNLKEDNEFSKASQSETASKTNVKKRIERAKAILLN